MTLFNDRRARRRRLSMDGFFDERPLARNGSMSETEDHLAYLCEVMRYLIAGEDVAVVNLTRQRDFFASHLQPWVLTLCDELQKHPRARFYAALAARVHQLIA